MTTTGRMYIHYRSDEQRALVTTTHIFLKESLFLLWVSFALAALLLELNKPCCVGANIAISVHAIWEAVYYLAPAIARLATALDTNAGFCNVMRTP